jgi:hypothetical protein
MVLPDQVRNGVIVLDDSVALPEGTPVQVQVVVPGEPTAKGHSVYELLQPLIGQATDLPPDGAQNIDHYLYGHPKSRAACWSICRSLPRCSARVTSCTNEPSNFPGRIGISV